MTSEPGPDLGPILPYPIRREKCRCCSARKLLLVHEGSISARGGSRDTLVCESCDTPDPRLTWSIRKTPPYGMAWDA